MMKRAILLALVLAVTSSTRAASSPAATQEWVQHYVATNTDVQAWVRNFIATNSTTTFDTSTVSTSVTNDAGEIETITLHFETADNDALEVYDSNADWMTNGTTYAKTDVYTYFNASAPCVGFVGAYEKFGNVATDGRYQYATNTAGEVTKLSVYTTTNEVWMTRFTIIHDDTVYKSTEIMPGVHYFKDVATGKTNWYMRASKIIDRARSRLITTSQLSALSLICPSAFAVTAGAKEIYKTEESLTQITEYWRRHYYTDTSDIVRIVIGTLDVQNANGGTITYELDITLVDIGAGIDLCNLKHMSPPTEEEILNEIAQKIGKNRTVQLTRSGVWQEELDSKLNEAKEFYNSISDTTCPEEGQDTKDKPDDDPIPPEEHKCTKVGGTCGHWVCVECGTFYESFDDAHPADHEFSGSPCQTCSICGTIPDDVDRHGGWHDATLISYTSGAYNTHACCCDCGKFSLSHVDNGLTVKYTQGENPLTCLRVWQCGRCGAVVEDYYTQKGSTVEASAHDEKTNYKYYAVVSNGMDICEMRYICMHLNAEGDSLGCGALRAEAFSHSIIWDNPKVSSVGDNDDHSVICPCGNGFEGWDGENLKWCGYTAPTNKPHKWSNKIARVGDEKYPPTNSAHKHIYCCGDIDTYEGDGHNTCGKVITINEDHENGVSIYGDPDTETHAVSNYCGVCGLWYPGTPNREKHDGPTVSWKINDMTTHWVSNLCTKCSTTYLANPSTETHEGPNSGYEYYTPAMHIVMKTCTKCRGVFPGGYETHLASGAANHQYTYNGDWTHKEMALCFYCNAYYPIYTKSSCTPGGYKLGNDTDYEICYYCHGTNEIDHVWKPTSETMHYCRNGNGHLYEDHEWGTGDDETICVKCGYDNATHTIPDKEDDDDDTHKICPSCACCTESSCAKWESSNCGCIMCLNAGTGGAIGTCNCLAAEVFPDDWDCPVAGSD